MYKTIDDFDDKNELYKDNNDFGINDVSEQEDDYISASSKVFQIHDKYNYETLSKKENAVSFLKSYLPKDIADDIDYDSLVLADTKNISEKLKKSELDILYKVNIKDREWYIYIMIEDKSYKDNQAIFQILRYMLDIWSKEIVDRNRLTPVLPILFYQGKNKWEFKQLSDLMDIDKKYKKYIPFYDVIFKDFSLENKMDIESSSLNLYLYLRLIQEIYEPDKNVFKKYIKELLILARKLNDKEYIETYEKLIIYVLNVRTDLQENDYNEILTDTGGENMRMTLAEKFMEQGVQKGIARGIQEGRKAGIQEGMQRGLQEGLQKGISSVVIFMNNKGLSVKDIKDNTGLSENEILLYINNKNSDI